MGQVEHLQWCLTCLVYVSFYPVLLVSLLIISHFVFVSVMPLYLLGWLLFSPFGHGDSRVMTHVALLLTCCLPVWIMKLAVSSAWCSLPPCRHFPIPRWPVSLVVNPSLIPLLLLRICFCTSFTEFASRHFAVSDRQLETQEEALELHENR